MLRIATARLALLRAIQTIPLSQAVPFRMGHFRSTIKLSSLMRRESGMTAFDHKPKVDGQRQEFSVSFDEHGTLYELGVSAPHYLSFYGVWGNVGCWLRHRPNHRWQSKDVEVVSKIVNQVCKMKHLQSFKDDGMEIIPVDNEEEANYLRGEYGIRNGVYDIRGSLTKLQGSLEAGAGQQGKYRELSDRSEKECELGWGIKMRLCKIGVHE